MGTLGDQEVAALLSPNKPDAIRVTQLPKTRAWTRTIPQLHDPATGLELWNTTADSLDRWHEAGRRSPRPAGQIAARPHHHFPRTLTRCASIRSCARRFSLPPRTCTTGKASTATATSSPRSNPPGNTTSAERGRSLQRGAPGNCTADHHTVSLG